MGGKLTILGCKIRIVGNDIPIIMTMTSPVHKRTDRCQVWHIQDSPMRTKESLWFKLLWITLEQTLSTMQGADSCPGPHDHGPCVW